jgi:glucose/arabinose dehydrogenase/PKD repeat protein
MGLMMSSSVVRSLGLVCALALFAPAAAWSPAAHATPLQPGFNESVVFSGMTEPTDLAFAPDGRVFVSEKSGLIKVFANLNATTPTISADLRTQVYNFWDRGLLSIAIDPQFPIRPYMYALYTADAGIGETAPRWGQPGATSDPCPTPPGATDAGCVVSTRLSKLTLSGNVVTNEQVLINDWCQQYPSHSAGGLAFGPDGMLYASGGDGASFEFADYGQDGQPRNPCGDPPVPVGGAQTAPTAEGGALRAQDIVTASDPTTLDGSLIRIDPDTGAGAPGNPMSTSSDTNARRIVATGMRNPFRFAMRPGSSEIYVGDVGWGAWEEIDRVPRADDATVDDFGWPCYEGNGRQPSYEGVGLNLCKQLYNTPGSVTSPLYTYEHGKQVVPGEDCHEAGGSSISGLAFYQGGNYPAAYTGALFFADYSRRCTWVIFEKNGQPDPATRASFLRDNDPVNIEIGPGGDLFVVDFTGSVRRVTYASGNRPPTAVALAQPQFGPLPLTVNFDGTSSSDPDAGDTLTYAWDLDGDGQYDDSNAAKPSWTYTSAATVTVRLRVTDKGGLSATNSVVIGAGNEPPHAHIDTPTTALHWAVGDVVSFSGGGSDPQDGTLGPGSMTWTLVMRHCDTIDNCHSHPIQSYPGVSEEKFTAPEHEYPSHLELRLTVTDSGGLSDTTTLRLDPRTVDLTFQTNPPGLTLTAGQQNAVTPFTKTVIVGTRNTVSAPTPQSLSGSSLGFASWSDGGARSHEIVAPETAATYTATYKPEAAPVGLVLGLGFEETSGTVVTDASSAKNNGTVNGATQTASGRFGRALSFDGVNDRVDVPDAASLELTNALTLEAWVRPTSSRLHAPVITKETSNYYTYRLEAGGEVKGIPEGFISDTAWSWEDAEDTKVLPNGTWSHLAMTYDGANMTLYVNGKPVSTRAAAKPKIDGLKLAIGAYKTNFYEGLIDEVRIYNRALSAVEIGTDMNTAVVSSGPPPTDSTPPSAPANLKATGTLGKVTLGWDISTDNVGVSGYEVYRSTTAGFTPAAANRIATPNALSYVDTVAPGTYYYRVKAADAAGNLSAASAEAAGTSIADKPPTISLTSPAAGTVSGTVTLKATASDDVGVSGVQFLVDGAPFGAEDTTAPYEIPWPSTAVANGTHKISARARDTAAQTTTSSEVTVTVNNSSPPPSSGLVLGLGFEETSGTVVTDASSAKNNGTVNGATQTASGRFGRALSFDGVNDRVDVPDAASLELTNALTLEAWVRPTSSRLHAPVITKETSNYYTYRLEAGGEVKGIPEGFISDTAWSWEDAEDTKVLPNGTWSHLAMTYDGANMTLYVNGKPVSTRAAAKPKIDGLKLAIGAYKTNFYEGLIDEVRIYNRALSAVEIGTDMNTPVTP